MNGQDCAIFSLSLDLIFRAGAVSQLLTNDVEGDQSDKLAVISWDTINETLLEDEYALKHGGDEDGPASAHLVFHQILNIRSSPNFCFSLCTAFLPIRSIETNHCQTLQ